MRRRSLGWARHRPWSEAARYFSRKGWRVERIAREQEMKCLDCDSENLKAQVTLVYDVPLAARMGTVKIGGMKVTQLDLKEAWDKQAIRGPIRCFDCGAEHYYVYGATDPLRKGAVADARTESDSA